MRKAFSLLELMIVVVVMAGALAIAWPNLTRRSKSIDKIIFEQKIKETVENSRYSNIMNGVSSVIVVKDDKIQTFTIDNILDCGDFDKRVFIDAEGNVYEE
jgi:prepilin-type N-terminal cleavage/methylation domain-containing protein